MKKINIITFSLFTSILLTGCSNMPEETNVSNNSEEDTQLKTVVPKQYHATQTSELKNETELVSETISTETKEIETEAILETNSTEKTEQTSSFSDSTEKGSLPTEHRSALRSAESYSDIMHMSKAALYDQLTSEYGDKFSDEAAQYAINSITVDWNDNALKSAEDYSDSMHLSKAALYDQLTSEYGDKFLPEEAQYAIDTITADWNDNALLTAENYQDSMDMSPEAIRDQLTSEFGEKFTQSEADYAISHLD